MGANSLTLSNDYSQMSNYGLPYNPQMLSQNVSLPGTGVNTSIFDTMKAMQTPAASTALNPQGDYSIGANFNLPWTDNQGFLSGIFGDNGFFGKNGWMGSDSAKNLGSFMGPLASGIAAYFDYGAAQDALDEQRRQNDFIQQYAAINQQNQKNALEYKAGNINAMENFSIAGNSDAVTPEQLAAWKTEGKEDLNLKAIS